MIACGIHVAVVLATFTRTDLLASSISKCEALRARAVIQVRADISTVAEPPTRVVHAIVDVVTHFTVTVEP